jgi:hypothetical protein
MEERAWMRELALDGVLLPEKEEWVERREDIEDFIYAYNNG